MAEALGAEKGERTSSRLGYRSGYYGRTLVTRIGKLELRVPIAAGKVRLAAGARDLLAFQPGEVLVAETTTPDWEPVMKRRGRSSPAAAGAPAMPRSSPASWASRPSSALKAPSRHCQPRRWSRSVAPKARPAGCIWANCLSR
jgi:hypothetical protein